jgi:hypothetical protein
MSGVVFAPSPSPVASVEAGGPDSSPAIRDTRFLVAHAGIFVPAHDLQGEEAARVGPGRDRSPRGGEEHRVDQRDRRSREKDDPAG